jgi:nucleoside-diphosphate-sugar epimerase
VTARRVLVTGGTGFVGANLVRRLLRDGHRVHLLVRREHAAWRLDGVRDDVELHEGSLDDLPAVWALVGRVRPEWVFHLAASGAYSWQQDLEAMVATNVVGTMNLLNTCLTIGFEAFVNTGTSSEYGYKDHAPHEREWLEPNSHYAVTKASATMFCRLTAQRENLHVPTLRLYSVFGPWEEPHRLVPTLVVRGLEAIRTSRAITSSPTTCARRTCGRRRRRGRSAVPCTTSAAACRRRCARSSMLRGG